MNNENTTFEEKLQNKDKKAQTKKYIVLIVLFILPLSVYMFFATGKNNFVKLPTLVYGVQTLGEFEDLSGNPIQLEKKITLLTFFGENVEGKKANAFNLSHKIYKKNYQFSEFQFVTLITDDQREVANALKEKISEIENPENWKFAIGTPKAIEEIYRSLKAPFQLDTNLASDYVFIIDKEKNLRGRNDDEDVGILYGYDASDYAEINNKMDDDVKVVLAEYRLALKKYKADRKDQFRDRN